MITNRQPAGVATGGQFAPSDHPESGVTLEPTLATEATWLTGYAAEQLREILDWDDVEQSLVATIDGELDEHNTGTLQYVTDLVCARLEAEHGVRPVGPHQRPALSIDVRPVGRSDAAIAVEYDYASGVVMSSGRLYWDDDVRPHLSTDHPRFEERMEAIYATINQHAAALLAEIKRIQA